MQEGISFKERYGILQSVNLFPHFMPLERLVLGGSWTCIYKYTPFLLCSWSGFSLALHALSSWVLRSSMDTYSVQE